MKCELCSKEAQAQSKYCRVHEKAYQNVQQKFQVWKNASHIEWNEYLKEIAKNPFTGKWAKEVAEKLLAGETKR